MPSITKEVLRQRTKDYRNWVEAFARNHDVHIEWAEKGVRKEEHILPWLRRMERKNAYGVYFIYQSMEQGPSFRSSPPKYPTDDPNYRILAPQRSRFMHYYFYIRDEVIGPMIFRVGTFFPFQSTYWINGHSFMEQELKRLKVPFRKNDNAFLAVDDPEALQAAADRLSAEIIRNRIEYWTLILGPKFSRRERHAMDLRRFYFLAQLRYDLRKMRAHGLLEREGSRYAYALTEKGIRTALLFVLFHQRLFGPVAHSQFVKRTGSERCVESKLERAYRRADAAIDTLFELLRAA